MRGGKSWAPVKVVEDALNEAFYLAFRTVEPTGKRWLLALDVSGSMGCGQVAGAPLTPREASAAMALVTAATEPGHHIVGFTGRGYQVSTAPSQQGAWAHYPKRRFGN